MACRRGTSNSNQRGSSEDRRRRREWLVKTYRADVDVSVMRQADGTVYDVQEYNARLDACGYQREPACRCYRCGRLLNVDTVSPDRIKPGAEGGTYRRENIRPACEGCQSRTGGHLGNARKKAKARVKGVQPIHVIPDELRDFLEDEVVSAEQLDAEIAASKAGAR